MQLFSIFQLKAVVCACQQVQYDRSRYIQTPAYTGAGRRGPRSALSSRAGAGGCRLPLPVHRPGAPSRSGRSPGARRRTGRIAATRAPGKVWRGRTVGRPGEPRGGLAGVNSGEAADDHDVDQAVERADALCGFQPADAGRHAHVQEGGAERRPAVSASRTWATAASPCRTQHSSTSGVGGTSAGPNNCSSSSVIRRGGATGRR